MPQPWEFVLLSLVSFPPFLLLEILAFRRNLRFSPPVTGLLVGALTLLQVSFAQLFPELNPRSFIMLGSLLSALLFLLITRDPLGKRLFMLLMIANDAHLIVVAAEAVLAIYPPRTIPSIGHFR